MTLLSAWGAAFIVALWLSLIYWTWRDAKSRLKEARLRFLALLFVILFFVPGALLYLLVRPQQTLADEYLQTLEEEALLRAIEESEEK